MRLGVGVGDTADLLRDALSADAWEALLLLLTADLGLVAGCFFVTAAFFGVFDRDTFEAATFFFETFFAGDFLVEVFLAEVFFAEVFFTEVFLVEVFFVDAAFLAVVFLLEVAFLPDVRAAVFRAAFFLLEGALRLVVDTDRFAETVFFTDFRTLAVFAFFLVAAFLAGMILASKTDSIKPAIIHMDCACGSTLCACGPKLEFHPLGKLPARLPVV